MKKHIYMEIGVVGLALVGGGVLFLLQHEGASEESYFLLGLGVVLLWVSLRHLKTPEK